MKKLLLVSVMLLSGCATINDVIDAYLMKYDSNEYQLITEIRTKAESAKNSCTNTVESKRLAKELTYTSAFLMHYAEHLPHNKPIQRATVELHDMVKGLSDRYDNGVVSPVFCKIKLTNIEESANRMQQSEGKKPR